MNSQDSFDEPFVEAVPDDDSSDVSLADAHAQSETTNALDIELLPAESSTATVRNEEQTEAFKFKASNFVFRVTEEYLVHGFYEGGKETTPSPMPATLIVYNIQFGRNARNAAAKRRVRFIDVTLRFEADPPGPPESDPFLAAFEPGGRGVGVFLYPSKVDRFLVTSKNFEASAKAPDPVPLGAKFGASKTRGKRFNTEDRATCTAMPGKTENKGGGRKGDNEVTWTLSDNDSQEVLPDVFAIALVIRRPATARVPNPNFKVTFDFDAKVDLRYDMSTSWDKVKDFFGGKRSKSKLYDATEIRNPLPPNLKDKNRIKDAVLDFGLREYAWFHVLEEVKPRKFYPQGIAAEIPPNDQTDGAADGAAGGAAGGGNEKEEKDDNKDKEEGDTENGGDDGDEDEEFFDIEDNFVDDFVPDPMVADL